MASNLEEIEKMIPKLSLEERVKLMRHLIDLFEEDSEFERTFPADYEQSWIETVKKRYLRYEKGETTAEPAKDVFKEARNRLK